MTLSLLRLFPAQRPADGPADGPAMDLSGSLPQEGPETPLSP